MLDLLGTHMLSEKNAQIVSIDFAMGVLVDHSEDR